jgi:hypothetical protein
VRTNRERYANGSPWLRAPLNWTFVVPYSGARRRADPCKTGFIAMDRHRADPSKNRNHRDLSPHGRPLQKPDPSRWLATGQTPVKSGSSGSPAAGQTPAKPDSSGSPAAGQTPVKSGSGARRATWVTNNTLNVSRTGSGAPFGLVHRKAVFRGSPCHLVSNNTLNVSRAGSGAPFGLVHRKAVFRGSPCYLGNKQHAQRFACRIGRLR